jgi:hypothetical protein
MRFGVEPWSGGGIGLAVPPDPSIGPLARAAPRPRTGGFEEGTTRSPDLSAGVFPVKTLLIARNGFPAFLGPRSPAAGPVGAPQPFGDDGIEP